MNLDLDPDAVLWSTPPAERDGRPLLVVMPGRGSDEHDLLSLAGQLSREELQNVAEFVQAQAH